MMAACRFTPLLIIAFATSLSAQSPVHSTVDAARAGNWYLRLTTLSGDTLQGRVIALQRDTFRLSNARIALADVSVIERRYRRGGGALPAGLFGAAVLGALGAGLSGLCESDCENAWVGPTLGGAAMGMALGSVAGAVVAPGRAEWRRMHPPFDSTGVPPIARQDVPQSHAGGGVTVSFGTGWSLEEQRYRVFRLALQLSSTSRAERPVESTGEIQLLAVTDGDGGAGAFYAGAGANFILENGAYVGPAFGFMFGDEPMPTFGGRVGLRPRRSGLRPELRTDYVVQAQALLLTLSLGLDVH